MAKVLKIEALAQPKRVLELFGKQYPVQEMTVENFIKTNAEAERLKDEKNQGVQIEATVDLISRSVPSVERSVLMGLELSQLLTIVQFVQGAMDEELTETTPEGDVKK